MTEDRLAVLKLLTEYPAQYGRMLGYKDMTDKLHGEWIKNMLYGHGDMTIQAHRGSFKTTAVGVALTIQLFLMGDKNSIFMRKTDEDIVEVIKQVQRNVMHPATQELCRAVTGKPLEIAKATASEITTNMYFAPRGAAQLLGIGMGGSITGKHADRIYTDDIVNLSDRKSRAFRDATKAIYQELQNIRNRGGRIINTGTPWHKDDAFSIMPKAQKYDCYSTGLLTEKNLEVLRQSMSPSLFAANYELRHIAIENALFETAPKFFKDATLLRDGIAHIDAAYGGEDWTAFTCGKRIGDTLYMYGKMWHTHVETVMDKIVDESQKLMCAPIYCEDNADKGFLAKEIRRKNPDIPTRRYHEKENKYQKISQYLRKWWNNIVWLEGTDRDYLAQIMDYTEDAEHDDAPDSASCVARFYDRRSGEDYVSPFEVKQNEVYKYSIS